MDNPPRPEEGYANPGCSATDASSLTTYNETFDAELQTVINDVQYLVEKESHGNTSTFTFDGSADAWEAMSAARNRCDNICSSVHSQGLHFSSSAEDSNGLNTVATSRNPSDAYGTAMVSSNPTHIWNRSASNYIFMSGTNPYPNIFKAEIFGKSGKDLSTDSQQDTNYDETFGLNATSQTAFQHRAVDGIDGQHIESHYDLSQIAPNDSEPCHVSELVASNSFCYTDRITAASGSSGCYRNANTPNVFGEMSQSSKNAEIKSLICEEVKALICRICKDEIAQHETEENVLKCFDSLYYNCEGTNILIHSPTHVPKTTCDICGQEHAAVNSHNSEHKCPDPECLMTFQCRTRFYQHITKHRKYFRKNCWVCIRRFTEHVTGKDSSYVCCVCGFESKNPAALGMHSLLHLPRCFCDLCKKEYFLEEKCFHGSEIKCYVCNDIFKCRIQLEEHFEGHVKYFSDHCRISESYINKPLFRCPFDCCFQSLIEAFFKNHLYSHAGLRVFKCETCERRFPHQTSLNTHSPNCKALPYKCEICETRFHTIDLLHSHGLMKHAGLIQLIL